MTQKKVHPWRYHSIGVIFCLVLVIYLGRLFYLQIFCGAPDDGSDTSTRRVTVQAVRGEIYDRNGVPLVTNRYTYDLTLSYAALARSGLHRANETCLAIANALTSTDEGARHVEKYFPYEGTYPYYTPSAEMGDPESVVAYRFSKVLATVGIDKNASVEQVVKYYTSTYDLLATDGDGRRVYDDDEVDRLIRLRYDMDAVGFKASGTYTYAKEVSLALMTYVKELSPVGVSFVVNASRVYNYPGYASHILGTVGPIYSEEWDYYNEQGYQMNAVVGKSGCEYAFEAHLHGIDGIYEIETDASGRVISTRVISEPIAGNDVYLTIDIKLQIAAEDGLRDNVREVIERSQGLPDHGANCAAGAAVALDPNTFDVLALASFPTYDLSTYQQSYNDLIADKSNPLFNRALNGLYAPGSTYKPGVSIVGLMRDQIAPTTTIPCGGVYTRYDDYRPKCSTYPHAYGSRLDVRHAIADSCNCFFYELGYRLGIDTLSSYMSRFGFGKATGLELGGQLGNQANADGWLAAEIPGLTLQAAIGQSDTVASPLQLACYLGTLTNGGTRYAAHLLQAVYPFGSDTPSYSYEPSEQNVLDRIEIPENDLAFVLSGMRDVVSGNSVVDRYIPNDLYDANGNRVTVGGKTGTAQNSSGCDNALFICAAPYDNPEIVISVVIEQGYTGGYSSFTAGRILSAYYNRSGN